MHHHHQHLLLLHPSLRKWWRRDLDRVKRKWEMNGRVTQTPPVSLLVTATASPVARGGGAAAESLGGGCLSRNVSWPHSALSFSSAHVHGRACQLSDAHSLQAGPRQGGGAGRCRTGGRRPRWKEGRKERRRDREIERKRGGSERE